MSVSERENLQSGSDQVDIVANARQFLERLPEHPKASAARIEGDAIATIVEPLGLSKRLLAAARIYPLVRDGVVPHAELSGGPLANVEGLVAGLVQLGRFTLPPDWRPGEALAIQQSEALRKMLLAVVSDARLVVIRIAEQLYRLRQAKPAPRKEQKALAIETREIYAALANRLGIWQLKWELEDLSFRYLEPETYKSLARTLNEKRVERELFIDDVKATLREALRAHDIVAEISGRPKHIYSIWRKMQRKDRGLDHIFDVRAVRLLVNDVSECYAALGVVHNLWSYLPGEFDDYIANPKDNNYQSLHTAVIGPQGQTLEVQIRTHEMHRHAELGIAAHWRYKEGGSPKGSFDQKIHLLRQLLEPANKETDLLAQISDGVFEDRVYAISPKGDIVDLPTRATPLDFAYHVHTEVGHRCRGAKVNGRIVPLTYHVQNGDRIEIITGRHPQPSRDWLSPQLGYLAATRSRTKVRNWFRHLDKEQNRRQGRDILDRELGRLNVRTVSAAEISRQLRYGDVEDLCAALGAGDVTSAAIVSAVQNLTKPEPTEVRRKRRRVRPQDASSKEIAISGVGDLLCNFARCCRPVPPETIVGYITQGRGVTIHRQDCGNYLSLHARHPERVIDVDWGNSADAIYPAELRLFAYDRQGLLRDISALLADENVSVESVQTKSDKKRMQAAMELRISVPGLPTLSRVIARLEQLPNVISVQRKS